MEPVVLPPAIKSGLLAAACGVAGRRSDAEREIAGPEAQATPDASPAFFIALGYAGLGQHGPALDWLERAYRERSLWMAWLKVEPLLNPVREEPRFRALLTKLAFDQ